MKNYITFETDRAQINFNKTGGLEVEITRGNNYVNFIMSSEEITKLLDFLNTIVGTKKG